MNETYERYRYDFIYLFQLMVHDTKKSDVCVTSLQECKRYRSTHLFYKNRRKSAGAFICSLYTIKFSILLIRKQVFLRDSFVLHYLHSKKKLWIKKNMKTLLVEDFFLMLKITFNDFIVVVCTMLFIFVYLNYCFR